MSRHWIPMSRRCEVCRCSFERQPGETAGNFRTRRTCSRKCLCQLREKIQEKRFKAEPEEHICKRCGRVFRSVNKRSICSRKMCLEMRAKGTTDIWVTRPDLDYAFSLAVDMISQRGARVEYALEAAREYTVSVEKLFGMEDAA